MSRLDSVKVTEPFVLHFVDGRYLVFEISTLKHLREIHCMCGVLIGTLPQITQQNVFLGLPLQLMPEEAAYLVRRGHAYIVDDKSVHQKTVATVTDWQLEDLKASKLRDRTLNEVAARKVKMEKKRAALESRGLTHLSIKLSIDDNESVASSGTASTKRQALDSGYTHVSTVSGSMIYKPQLHNDPQDARVQPAPPDPRYDFFSHLHELGYFLTPGLRFGAQFVAYPGDPLRFHSHFVASGYAWGEEIPIMDVVGGGRLGTGVKKAWLVGGKKPEGGQVKCFTVEWAGM